MRKQIDGMIAALLLMMALLLGLMVDLRTCWYWIALAVILAGLHIWWAMKEGQRESRRESAAVEQGRMPEGTLTEIVLLGEDDTRLASWNIYGKNGLVIGRDIGENHVSINLEDTTYASMIDIEHAVLNYSKDSWYVEDISQKNGISVQKRDGRKYRLSYGKPCRLERGDIIYVALTRLQIL